MRKMILGMLTALVMVCSIGAKAAAEPVGVVDFQKISQAISFQELFKKKMEESMSNSRQEIEALTKAMQEKQKQLTDSTKLTDEQKKLLTDAVDEQKKKLSEKQAEVQKSAMALRTDFTKELKQKVEDATGRVAAKHNLSMVFQSNSLAYAADKIDLTDELIADLSSSLGVKPKSEAEQLQSQKGAAASIMQARPMKQ